MNMVPQLIHQIVGKKPSKLAQICLKSWQALENRGFEIVYWDDDMLKEFIGEHYPFSLPAFLAARNHAEAADIGRYLVVHHYGGYYVDWDISLNDVEAFIHLAEREKRGYLVEDPMNQTLASEHFSACRADSYLYALTTDIVDVFDRGERDAISTPDYSGPFRMRETLKKMETVELTRIPVKDIFEYSYAEIRRQPEYRKSGIMTHFWEHSWMRLPKMAQQKN